MNVEEQARLERAQRILEKELKQSVVVNDDGSKPSMYDLRIGTADAPTVAIECVGAVDQTFTETWNVGPARGPLQLALAGDWSILLSPNARIKTIKQRIEPLLREAENRGLHSLPINHELERYDFALYKQFESLNITYASCYQLPGTGKVNLRMTGSTSVTDTQRSTLAKWVGEFLRDPKRNDVLDKLQKSGAPGRHAFIFVSLAGAPQPVESYLTGDLDQLPTEAPDLPPPVTGVWIVSGLGHSGVRWDGSAWRLFEAQGEEIDT